MNARTKPILRWQGGKSRLLKHLMPLIGDHDCYCETFFGGGAMLFAKERSSVEVNRAYKGWDKKQLTEFRREVGRLKGKWIVTLNDSPFTRELFSDCALKPIVSENRAVNRRTHAEQKFGELIITPK